MARWDDSVQHFGCAGVRMDQPARMYLCARCRVQVILCSRCDRGNRYCGRQCSGQARRQARRETAQRYQRSWGGRIAHARRSRRWRQRLAQREAARAGGCSEHNVTHQGSQPAVSSAPLAAWTHHIAPTAPLLAAQELAALNVAQDVAPAVAPAAGPAGWICRRCGQRQPAALRLGFVRHGRAGRWRHDHSP